jgi:two-component system response regulator
MMHDTDIDVLIVEDNSSDLELALRALKEHRLCNNLVVARDGLEALDYLFAEGRYAGRRVEDQPRVILLDLKLPLVDGIEVLRRIRSDPRTHALPVVAMTASNRERDVAETYELGINSYIVKPVDFHKFTEAMKMIGMYWLMLNRAPSVP